MELWKYSDRFNDLGVPVYTVGAERHFKHVILFYKLKQGKDWIKLERAKKKICRAFGAEEYPGELKHGADFAIMVTLPPEDWTTYKYEQYGAEFQKTAKIGDMEIGVPFDADDLIINIYDTKSILIAGSSGGGKSSLLNCMIDSLIISGGDNIHLDFIDLKRVEFAFWEKFPQTLHKVANNKREAADLLRYVKDEIDRRYNILSAQGKLKATPEDFPPYVIFIDEFATLEASAGTVIHSLVSYITAVGRAAGVYLVIATQHPRNNVIDNIIRANCSTKIVFACANSAQSTTICGSRIGVDLLGKGDGYIFLSDRVKPIRFQAPLYDEETRRRRFNFI